MSVSNQFFVLSLLALAFGVGGCTELSPSLDLWDAAIAGDRLKFLVSSSITISPFHRAAHTEDQINYLVSAPLGPTKSDVRLAVADLSAGGPNPDTHQFWLGAAADRVVRHSPIGEHVRNDEQVDVLAPPDRAVGSGVQRWRVLRSWRLPLPPPITRSGRFVAVNDEMSVVDVKTLQPVSAPELSQTLRSIWFSDCRISGLTAHLNYIWTEDPYVALDSKEKAETAVDRHGIAVASFPRVSSQGVLLAIDEFGAKDAKADQGQLWGLYFQPLPASKQCRYELIDAAGMVQCSTVVPWRLSAAPWGSPRATWDVDRHLILFFDCGKGVAEGDGGAVVVRIWDYRTGESRDQSVDVRGAFHLVGGRYVPKR
jgi:hypothetical protein